MPGCRHFYDILRASIEVLSMLELYPRVTVQMFGISVITYFPKKTDVAARISRD